MVNIGMTEVCGVRLEEHQSDSGHNPGKLPRRVMVILSICSLLLVVSPVDSVGSMDVRHQIASASREVHGQIALGSVCAYFSSWMIITGRGLHIWLGATAAAHSSPRRATRACHLGASGHPAGRRQRKRSSAAMVP